LRFSKYSLLHEDEWLPEAKMWDVLASTVQARKQVGNKAVEVFGDYTTQLWNACLPQLMKDLPNGIRRGDCVRGLVLTYPAGWPTHMFEEAVKNAILSSSTYENCTVTFITEAEAAVDAITQDATSGLVNCVELQVGRSFSNQKLPSVCLQLSVPEREYRGANGCRSLVIPSSWLIVEG